MHGLPEKLSVIVDGQVRREQAQRRQIEAAVAQHGQNDRKGPDHSRGSGAVASSVFGQQEHLAAVREERRKSGAQVELPRFHFRKVRDELRCRRPLARRKAPDFSDKLLVREVRRKGHHRDREYQSTRSQQVRVDYRRLINNIVNREFISEWMPSRPSLGVGRSYRGAIGQR